MNLQIRLAEPETDRAFVESLDARLFEPIEAPAHSRTQIEIFQRRFTATAWREGGGAIFIAESEESERLGYMNVRTGQDDVAEEPCAYIALLAVIPEAEGSGVAAALLERAEEWTREQGYTLLSLDVFSSNQRAQRFYNKAGFGAETMRLVKRL